MKSTKEKRKKRIIQTVNNSNCTVEKAAELLQNGNKILIFVHSHPDGDTLGSAYALKAALGEKDVRVVCSTHISDRLSFISEDKTELLLPSDFTPDLVVCADIAELGMMDDFGDMFRDKIDLKIDHHRTSEPFAKYNLIDSCAASCAEIVYEIIRKMDALNDKSAFNLYIGVSTDTGCFKYGNTTAKTHEIASHLMQFGFDVGKLNTRLFDSKTVGEITAMRLALNGLHFYSGGKIAVISFTNEMKEKYGITDDDLALINSLPREIEGVSLGVTIKEKADENGTYKVSMRSGGEVDASALCEIFGGGGHVGAAGCRVKADSAENAEKKLIDAIKDFVK